MALFGVYVLESKLAWQAALPDLKKKKVLTENKPT
jgi:hypothetical protein